MNYSYKNPRWDNRDRFVLSAGHGSMLLKFAPSALKSRLFSLKPIRISASSSGFLRDSLIALISAILLKERAGVIVTDSVTSGGLTEFIESLGGKHLRFKRGYKNVIDKCRELNESGIYSPLAIETSGHFSFSTLSPAVCVAISFNSSIKFAPSALKSRLFSLTYVHSQEKRRHHKNFVCRSYSARKLRSGFNARRFAVFRMTGC